MHEHKDLLKRLGQICSGCSRDACRLAYMIIITVFGPVDGMCGCNHCMYNMCVYIQYVLPLCDDIIIVLMPLVCVV